MDRSAMSGNRTYLNPVFDRDFPDPYVLKHRGEYWAYCTGIRPDGRCFGVMRSPDLLVWEALGGAMEPLPGGATCYWAPEVVHDNGRFLMYYSVGNETFMEIRVAVATHPAGPFVDSGHRLTEQDFAIDAHVFEDEDGRRYLFYATDFLHHTHIGTGTVVDLMVDEFHLAGDPRPVTRARYDWQVYDPQRAEKGGVRWYTVEGPFVLRRKGLYYEMFSGGNWKNTTYGVSFAVSDRLDREDEWPQFSDGERTLPILRTLPGVVTGPGHNSVARGPDNRQLFCVYHLWAHGERVLAIDRLEWVGERMAVLGPTTSPQPAPLWPAVSGFHATGGGLGEAWEAAPDAWRVADGVAATAGGRAGHALAAGHFLLEISLRSPAGGDCGVALAADDGEAARFMLRPAAREFLIATRDGADWREERRPLPDRFRPDAFHLLRLEVNGALVSLRVEDLPGTWRGRLDARPARLELVGEGEAEFAGPALTYGWQDLFEEDGVTAGALGWRSPEPGALFRIEDRQLFLEDVGGLGARLVKELAGADFEWVVNVRLDRPTGEGGCFGFCPALDAGAEGPLLTVEREGEGWAVFERGAGLRLPLPATFDPALWQQFRFTKAGGRLRVQLEAVELGEIEVPAAPVQVGLYVRAAAAAFDEVRVTAAGG